MSELCCVDHTHIHAHTLSHITCSLRALFSLRSVQHQHHHPLSVSAVASVTLSILTTLARVGRTCTTFSRISSVCSFGVLPRARSDGFFRLCDSPMPCLAFRVATSRLGKPNVAVVVAVEKQTCTLRFFYRPEQTRHHIKEVYVHGMAQPPLRMCTT